MMNARDRRARRTRTNLEEGLLCLMEQKSINSITVRELTEFVDINRSTFYLHYNDIYDMVSQMENALINQFYNEIEKDREGLERTTQEDVYLFMEKAVELLRKNRREILILCGENGDHTFIERLTEVTYKQAHSWLQSILGQNANPMRVELAVSFFCSGCVTLLETWLKSDESISTKAVIDLMFTLVLKGRSGFWE